MSRNGKDVMLLAGKSGGKTTFLGAFAMRMNRNNMQSARDSNSFLGSVSDLLNIKTGLTGDYDVIKGDDDFFDGGNKSVLDRMRSQMYPPGNDQRDDYILEFRINSNLQDTATIRFTIMDIPGEEQRIQQIRNNNYSAGDVMSTYNSGIRNRPSVQAVIEDKNKSLKKKEWEKAFLYEYLQSDNLILLVNLHKVQKNKSLDFMIDKNLIEEVSSNRRCLLLFTAVDIVDHDPDDFRVGSLTGGGIKAQNFDTDLYDKLDPDNSQSSISRDAGSKVLPLADKAQQEGVDMFGVSVPEAGNNRIQDKNGKTVLKGIDNVGKWLKQN